MTIVWVRANSIVKIGYSNVCCVKVVFLLILDLMAFDPCSYRFRMAGAPSWKQFWWYNWWFLKRIKAPSVLVCEEMAIRESCRIALASGYPNITIESDNLHVIKHCCGECSVIIEDIKLLSRVSIFLFSFVRDRVVEVCIG